MAFKRLAGILKISGGREFWRNLNRIIGISMYTVILLCVLVFPMYLLYIMFLFAIILPSYIAFFINHLRKMEKKDKGNKVIEGWITHALGVGERVYFYPESFELIDKLSPSDIESVNEYIKELNEDSKNIDVGLNRFKSKKISRNNVKNDAEINKMNKMERQKFDDEEKNEKDEYMEDYNKNIKENRTKMRKEILIKGVDIENE